MSMLTRIRAWFARWNAKLSAIQLELGGNVEAALPKVLSASGSKHISITITPAEAHALELPWDDQLASTVASGKVVRDMMEQLAVALRKRNRVLQGYLMLPGANVLCIKFWWGVEQLQVCRPAGVKMY